MITPERLDQAEATLLPIVSHHCRTTHSACDCVLATLARYREALTFYATEKNYEIDDKDGYIPDAEFPIFDDNGARARAALAGEGGGGL